MELLEMIEVEQNQGVRVIFGRKQALQWLFFLGGSICFPIVSHKLIFFEMDSERFEPFISSFFDEWEELWNLWQQMNKIDKQITVHRISPLQRIGTECADCSTHAEISPSGPRVRCR